MAKNASLPAGAGKGLAELRSRLWFVFLALLVYRIGAHIPVPGINPDRLAALFEQNQGTILSMFNMFSGGALERMSIFALGIMRWIIDPIDGTKAFISGKPAFGTLVGLLHHNLPVAGLVDMPIFAECYIGLNGFSDTHHAKLNGAAITPSGQSVLGAARLATTSPRALSAKRLVDFDLLADQVAITNYGGDCHNYALLAAGHIDLVMEDSLAAHDMMAVVALMLAAGATVSDLDGQPIQLGQSTSILAAATPQLHQAALALISASD